MRAEQINELKNDPRTVRVGARAPRWVIPSVKVALVLVDLAFAALSFLAAFYLREGGSIFQQA